MMINFSKYIYTCLWPRFLDLQVPLWDEGSSIYILRVFKVRTSACCVIIIRDLRFTVIVQSRFFDTVESLNLIVAQFLWHLFLALPQEFISSTKTKWDRVIFLTETINRRIHEDIWQQLRNPPHPPPQKKSRNIGPQ